LKVLVLAEDYHFEPVREIALRAGARSIRVRPMRGNRVEKLVGYIRYHPDYDRFVVLKDLEHYDEKILVERFRKVLERLPEIERNRITLVLVKRAIEAWLLADPDAVEKAAGCEIGRRTRQRLADPEGILNPKEELRKIFEKCGKIYNIRLAIKIAKHIRLEEARQRAPSLDAFLKAISALPKS